MNIDFYLMSDRNLMVKMMSIAASAILTDHTFGNRLT